jgi:hypothetical protein
LCACVLSLSSCGYGVMCSHERKCMQVNLKKKKTA